MRESGFTVLLALGVAGWLLLVGAYGWAGFVLWFGLGWALGFALSGAGFGKSFTLFGLMVVCVALGGFVGWHVPEPSYPVARLLDMAEEPGFGMAFGIASGFAATGWLGWLLVLLFGRRARRVGSGRRGVLVTVVRSITFRR